MKRSIPLSAALLALALPVLAAAEAPSLAALHDAIFAPAATQASTPLAPDAAKRCHVTATCQGGGSVSCTGTTPTDCRFLDGCFVECAGVVHECRVRCD